MITNEELKEFALKYKENNGSFPVVTDWKRTNGFPIGYVTLLKRFKSYNDFRYFCNEPEIIRTNPITLEWLKSNCNIDSDNCWNWVGQLTENEYGQVSVNGIKVRTHRLAYELFYNKKIDTSKTIDHICGNKVCCNPQHLREATRYEQASNRIQNKNKDLVGKSFRLVRNKSLVETINIYLNNTRKENCWVISLDFKKQSLDKYYTIKKNQKAYRLHILVWMQKQGIELTKDNYEQQTSSGNVIRHLCNNKACINPDHLKSGTRRENALDSK